MISARVVLDSIAPNGSRLTTLELIYPRFIHSEIMTHRMFSRNAASSRAIPVSKKIERIRAERAEPSQWGSKKLGMQAGPQIQELNRAKEVWAEACNSALEYAAKLDALGCHKQIANRVLEPFDHILVILSATEFANHDKLRLAADEGGPLADPTYYELANKMKAARDSSTPTFVEVGQWHMPFGGPKESSVGKCARASYMRQGEGTDEENKSLHDRLAKSGHWSPFEHIATPIEYRQVEGKNFCDYCWNVDDKCVKFGSARVICHKCAKGHITSGNFVGWRQYREELDV